ncbi:MAG TPA: ATP-binding protein [Chloroflexota bacterium]|nr:ATP-binding protein [Chloroflexota bacterium]
MDDLTYSTEMVPTYLKSPADDLLARLDADIAAAGGPLDPDPDMEGAIGATMFDLASSEDGSVTVLLPRQNLDAAPSQALTRIASRDGRRYLGTVTKGPFAEPDSIRGDSHMLITVATRGGIYLPPYHGRVQVSLLGEEMPDGSLRPPLLRPLPNSPVRVLDDDEAARILGTEGDIRLGRAANYARLDVRVPSDRKDIFPRHTAILGTTGGGKSTTVANLVKEAQATGMAVILLDVEGEYAFLHEPTEDQRMVTALAERDRRPDGVDNVTLYHLVDHESANEDHPRRQAFSLQFARLSPYAVMEILDMTDAQQERFLRAYDIAKIILRRVGIFPRPGNADQERLALEVDEFERGYPRITLALLRDIVGACLAHLDGGAEYVPQARELQSTEAKEILKAQTHKSDLPKFPVSWRTLGGKLARLARLRVFDQAKARPLTYADMLQPGAVSVIDLSDSGATDISNIVIADLLRGVQEAQDEAYKTYEDVKRGGHLPGPPVRTLIVIEEAHEFLSDERIDKMPVLFQQVARIAKRGRKRWLGLVFVTQLPQHLPRQVFGLVNSYILHKITDPGVVSTLQRTVSGIDEALWNRLPGLAPGQAIVSFPHMTIPLLVAMDPTPAKLRLVD